MQSLNDAIKIVDTLKQRINACNELYTDNLGFTHSEYEKALEAVLYVSRAYRNSVCDIERKLDEENNHV